jgi:hypothetical protein
MSGLSERLSDDDLDAIARVFGAVHARRAARLATEQAKAQNPLSNRGNPRRAGVTGAEAN